MTEKKGGAGYGSTPPAAESSPDLKEQRDTFVHTFFKKGAEFTEELVRENDRLRKHLGDVENENAALRTQLASDEAIRDLLRKIEQLEREKQLLLSHVTEVQAVSTRFSSRYEEMETEISNLANLYVASYQLHSTLKLRTVVQHLKELLQQLVGARAHSFYVADPAQKELVPVASDGIELTKLPKITVGAKSPEGGLATVIERVFLTGVPYIQGAKKVDDAPAACVPMRIDDRVVGAIVVYSLLEQKEDFAPVDHELFKMLGAHAATALMGALLFANADGKLPSLEPLHNLGV